MKFVKLLLLGVIVVFVLALAFPAAAAPASDNLHAPRTCVYLVIYQVDGAGWFGTGYTVNIVYFQAGADNICRFPDSKVLRVRIVGYMAL